MIPLVDMTRDDRYQGRRGGLYGSGRNTPPLEHHQAVVGHAAAIEPLDTNGVPDPNGLIGLASIGMSNTKSEWLSFMGRAQVTAGCNSTSVVLVQGAQGGMDAAVWAGTSSSRPDLDPWPGLADSVAQAGLSPLQLQAVWLLQAHAEPAVNFPGSFPTESMSLRDNIVLALQRLKTEYPNVQVAYLSSRIYGGYATTDTNPEPYAYEGGFAIQKLIIDQARHLPEAAPPLVPSVVWGPYLWADGLNPRYDGLVWEPDDFKADGTHPSNIGAAKVARMLMDYMLASPYTRWFRQPPDVSSEWIRGIGYEETASVTTIEAPARSASQSVARPLTWPRSKSWGSTQTISKSRDGAGVLMGPMVTADWEALLEFPPRVRAEDRFHAKEDVASPSVIPDGREDAGGIFTADPPRKRGLQSARLTGSHAQVMA